MAWEKLGSTSVGGASDPVNNSWKEIGRTTLGSAGDDITVSSFTAKDNLMILCSTISTGNIDGALRFNTDTGSNYAIRRSENGGSDATGTSQAKLILDRGHAAYPNNTFSVSNMNNISAQEKLVIGHSIAGVNGAGTAPDRTEMTGKWANTSAQVTSVTCNNSDSGSWDTGSEVVVLGCDNDEADSGTNFWQQLADVDLGSDGTILSSGSFTSKKYLMVSIHAIASGGMDSRLYFNSDGGSGGSSNYAWRMSKNGASDSTTASTYGINTEEGAWNNAYYNFFIINKSDKEKLVVGDVVHDSDTSGAGTASTRNEVTGKWITTGSQINTVAIKNIDSGDYASGSRITVWGAD